MNTGPTPSRTNRAIRPWTRRDLTPVAKIMWVTWLDTYGRFIPEEDMSSYFDKHYNPSALAALFADPAVEGLVGEVDNRVVGYAINRFDAGEGRYYASSLYILPDFQGIGLGGELLAEAGRRAKLRGLDRIWLGAMTQNFASVEWYRRKGFVFETEIPFAMGKTTVPHLIGYKFV